MNLTWELEVIQQREATLYVTGWLFDAEARPESLQLELVDCARRVVGTIPLDAGKPRPDVAATHLRYPNSLYSGFVGVGSWPRRPQRGDRLRIAGLLVNGRSVQLEIPSGRWQQGLQRESRWHRLQSRLRTIRYYSGKALMLIATGRIDSLREKITRQVADRPQAPLPSPPAWKELLSSSASDLKSRKIHLIVDHRLGGGANQYRERLVKVWLSEGASVLTLTFHLASLSLMLVMESPAQQQRYTIKDEEELLHAIADIRLTSITYNTAVSFDHPDRIPSLLLKLKHQSSARLTILLHDYFLICPSHFLLNADGLFCGIPDPAICRRCLPRNSNGFTSLFRSEDILVWRQAWGPLVHAADTIMVFSESSADLLRKAYGSWLNEASISVKPHTINYLTHERPKITNRDHLTIGVVGQIGFHKGSRIVQELASEIRQRGGSERIVVIGTLEAQADAAIVNQTGPYRHNELTDRISRSGTNIMLIPSIWPETFSYVCQELIELELPIACFDLGAPAERIRKYHKGLVLTSMAPGDILHELNSFFQQTYQIPR